MNNFFFFVFARTYFQSIFTLLHKLSLAGMNYGGGASVESSGEIQTLKRLAETAKAKVIVFDVGANVGDFAIAVEREIDVDVIVHCFEPAKTTFAQLQKRLSTHDNMKLNHMGLSDRKQNLILYENPKQSGFASLYPRRLDHYDIHLNKKESVKLETLDAYCTSHKIKHIDLLKMDVEGHELSVLRGAKNMLQRGAIEMIQFEFGGCNIDSRTYFQDFFYLLHPKYDLYRLLQDGMALIDHYGEINEVFVTTNYLAIKRK